MPEIALSLIIPAWNEAALLPRLLESVDVARRRWCAAGHAEAELEVIVADNGSTDATVAIALARGCKVAQVSKRVIAANRNGGAALAQGRVLAFVDADSVLHPDCLVAVREAMQRPDCLGGASGVTMERWSAGIVLTYALMLPMVWLSGMDTGVVFFRKADFDALGGYDESLLMAEDVHYLRRLQALGRPRRQRLLRLRGVKAITSTRKFDRHGDWHFFIHVPGVLWRFLRRGRAAAETFAQRYWYQDR